MKGRVKLSYIRKVRPLSNSRPNESLVSCEVRKKIIFLYVKNNFRPTREIENSLRRMILRHDVIKGSK